jgi:hypothetical protein
VPVVRKIVARMIAALAVVLFAIGLPAAANAQPSGGAATAPRQYEIGPVTVCSVYHILWLEICI